MIVIRIVFAAAVFLIGITALAGFTPLLIGAAMAQDSTEARLMDARLAEPRSLPDMALGSTDAPVRIVEYTSIVCPHCAEFGANVFPMLKEKYIDTGKVHFVFREFPRNGKDQAAMMLARCIADTSKFYAVIAQFFKQQDQLMRQTIETLRLIGKQQAGMDNSAVDKCWGDQSLAEDLLRDWNFAVDAFGVDATPTFFINGKRFVGAPAFWELEAMIKPLLKK
ncbi:hypothetical protein UP09_31435 [Bradyrhizobium sp. LTSP885]|nr:hypothetical protein UP09_31435 [Bradyrhizobium sp. LTSP885]